MLKGSEDAQEFNDRFDDLKEKEDFVVRLKKKRNGLEKENKDVRDTLRKQAEEFQEFKKQGEKQKKMLGDMLEKNYGHEKEATKCKEQSEVMKNK